MKQDEKITYCKCKDCGDEFLEDYLSEYNGCVCCGSKNIEIIHTTYAEYHGLREATHDPR